MKKEVFMSKEITNKIFDILHKKSYPLTLNKNDGSSVSIGYNKRTTEYGIAYRSKTGSEMISRRLNRLDIIKFIRDENFTEEAEEYCAKMSEKEKNYMNLRMRLLNKLGDANMEMDEKSNMKRVIERLTEVPEYAIHSPRIGIKSEQNGHYTTNQYLRVGNEYDRSHGIDVQRITRVTDENGSNTNYERVDFNTLVSIVRKNNIKIDPDEKKEETRFINI